MSAMSESEEGAPSKRVLQWVAKSAGPHAEVVSVKRLPGGISSAVHGISLRVGPAVQHFVLRRFDNEQWLREEPDLAYHEAESLRRASEIDLPTPRIVAWDATGSECGVPAVLMTRLEGSVVLRPPHMTDWLDGLAESLARIHSVEADDCPWAYFTYTDIGALQTPAWSSFPDLWGAVVEIVKGPRPQVRECFIHRDYHPGNVLWAHGEVSGVVDWVNACRGPRGIDVGHCRVNLAQLSGVAVADAFLSAYEHHAGSAFCHDPYWDILSLVDVLSGPPEVYPGWAAFGVTGLTDKLMMERLDAYAASLLARISGTSSIRGATRCAQSM